VGFREIPIVQERSYISLVDYQATAADIIIDGSKLVAPLHLEGKTPDGKPLVMDNLDFWTFENGKDEPEYSLDAIKESNPEYERR